MASETLQELCAECLKKKSCEYIPPPGSKLLRCLDRQAPAGVVEPAGIYSDAAGSSDNQDSSAAR